MMIGTFFTADCWVSDGKFAAIAPEIKRDSSELLAMVQSLRESQMADIVLGQKTEYQELEVYEFDGIPTVPIRVQRMYINLITSGYPNLYQYTYVPAPHKVVCIFDEDGLVGFVARIKNEGEE